MFPLDYFEVFDLKYIRRVHRKGSWKYRNQNFDNYYELGEGRKSNSRYPFSVEKKSQFY